MSASNQYSPSDAAKNWKVNIIRSLKCCKEHGWLLSAGIALLAAVSVFNYSMRENVPINLTSASAIASLPAIFAAIACVIILLSSFILLPTAITFIPPIAGRPTSIARIFSGRPKVRIKARKSLHLALIVPTITTSTIIFSFSYYSNAKNSLFGLAVFSCIILSVTSFIRIIGGKGNSFFTEYLSRFSGCLDSSIIDPNSYLAICSEVLIDFSHRRKKLDSGIFYSFYCCSFDSYTPTNLRCSRSITTTCQLKASQPSILNNFRYRLGNVRFPPDWINVGWICNAIDGFRWPQLRGNQVVQIRA